MSKKINLLIAFLMVSILFSQGTTGKISGVVKDQDTGDFLPGVNVLVEGTSLGASTDVDGFYVILNVPVGVQKLRFSYVGYTDVIVANVVVSVDLTTEQNASMKTEVGGEDEVLVVAQRQIVRKDQTNNTVIKTAEEVKNVPVRDVQSLVAITAGVIKQDNSTNVFVRGGRANETAFVVDGVNQNNVLNGVVTQRVSRNAIEQIQVQTGGFGAEYGDIMSGLVHITQKSGSEKYEGGIEISTDNFTGGDGWGSRSYGQNFYNAYLSGPVIPNNKNILFFANVEYLDNADRAPNYEVNGIAQKPGNDQTSLTLNLKTKLLLGENTNVKLGFNMTDEEHGIFAMFRYYNVGDQAYQHNDAKSYTMEATHVFDKNFYAVLKGSYSINERKQGNRKWMSDLRKYGDSAANNHSQANGTANGYRIFPVFNATFNPENGLATNNPYNLFHRNSNEKYQASLDLNYRIDKHDLKAGFSFTTNTVRYFNINPRQIAAAGFKNDFASYRDQASIRYYGYDWNGSVSDNDDWSYYNDLDNLTGNETFGDGPKKPTSFGLYVNDKFEFGDIILNLGLRYDSFNANTWAFKDVTKTYADGKFQADDVEDSKTFTSLSPRLGVSFPVDEKSMFAMNFGTFFQFPNLQRLYLSRAYATERYEENSASRVMENPNLKPSKTTSYELSYTTEVSDGIGVRLNAYYKETKDLLNERLTDIENTSNPLVTQMAVMQNLDFGFVRGIDLSINTRRVNNLQTSATFSFQTAQATGSTDRGNSRISWLNGELPRSINPVNTDQPFTGNINLDYRFANDGPLEILNNFGANFLTTFYTGRPFTKYAETVSNPFTAQTSIPVESVINGARAPFVFRADLRLDKTFRLMDDKLGVNVYLDIRNIFNIKNEINVYQGSGRADRSGWLGTDEGKSWLSGQISSNAIRTNPYPYPLSPVTGKAFTAQEAAEFYENNPTGYGLPRQITAGIRIDF